jgi:hypothetical protein
MTAARRARQIEGYSRLNSIQGSRASISTGRTCRWRRFRRPSAGSGLNSSSTGDGIGAVARFLGAGPLSFAIWLSRGSRRPVDSRGPLDFHRRDAWNGLERCEAVSLDGAGKDTDPGQGRVRPKPESVAGVSHLAQSFEGIVSDGNGHADLHGVRSGRPNESGTNVPGRKSKSLRVYSLSHGFLALLRKSRAARHYLISVARDRPVSADGDSPY